MTYDLAQAVYLINPVKPIIVLIVLGAWAWMASTLDKDMNYYYLQRKAWNAVQMAAAIAAFGLWLVIPIFWLAMPLALIVLAGAGLAYVTYRNREVPEDARWTLSADTFRQALAEKEAIRRQKRATVHLLSAKDDAMLEVPVGDTPHARAHLLIEKVVEHALPRGADQIEIAVNAQKAVLAVRIDGVQYPMRDLGLTPAGALELMEYLKGAAEMDLSDQRRKQTGYFKLDGAELGKHELGVLTFGSTQGRQMTLTIDPREQSSMPLAELGLLESQRKQLDDLLKFQGRIVIVASPSNNGLTSTLYTLLQRHDPYTTSVWTLEDRVPIELEGVTHETISPDISLAELKKKVEVVFRRDPQVLFYGRPPSDDIARLLARNGRDVRIYVGVNASDTFDALRQWIKLVGDVDAATKNLGAIISQRLVRRLCGTCRAAYRPDASAMKKLNLPVDRVSMLYKASGQVLINKKPQQCPDCLAMGYKGRTGVFEVLVLADAAKKMIVEKKLNDLRSLLRKQKMLWMQEAALAKVLEGVSDIREITRVFGARGRSGGSSVVTRSLSSSSEKTKAGFDAAKSANQSSG